MKVQEIMTTDVYIASPSDTLLNAATIMDEQDFGLLPVAENDRLVGMLSDRDITIRAVARGLVPATCEVHEVMSIDVMYIYDDETMEDAARNMSNLQVRRLPVLNRDKRLVGIVSLGDLALKEKRRAGSALNGISQP